MKTTPNNLRRQVALLKLCRAPLYASILLAGVLLIRLPLSDGSSSRAASRVEQAPAEQSPAPASHHANMAPVAVNDHQTIERETSAAPVQEDAPAERVDGVSKSAARPEGPSSEAVTREPSDKHGPTTPPKWKETVVDELLFSQLASALKLGRQSGELVEQWTAAAAQSRQRLAETLIRLAIEKNQRDPNATTSSHDSAGALSGVVNESPVETTRCQIHNPEDSGGVVYYLLNNVAFSLHPGQWHEAAIDDELRFHRGDEFGEQRLRLSAGTHVFTVTDKGWELLPSQAIKGNR